MSTVSKPNSQIGLVAGCLAGNPESIDSLRALCADILLKSARQRIFPVDDDLYDEVCEKVMQALPSFRRESGLATWIWSIVQREISNRKRHIRAVARAHEALWILNNLNLKDPEAQEDLQTVLRVISALPEELKLVFVLRMDGHTEREIAKQLSRPSTAVHSMIGRARRLLRQNGEYCEVERRRRRSLRRRKAGSKAPEGEDNNG